MLGMSSLTEGFLALGVDAWIHVVLVPKSSPTSMRSVPTLDTALVFVDVLALVFIFVVGFVVSFERKNLCFD